MTDDGTGRGAPGRVAAVHHQARRTLVQAAVFVVAAASAAVVPHGSDTWLPLHLFLVGGVLSAISGATQMLAVTWSASPAPARRTASVQRALIGVGAGGVAFGHELEAPDWLVAAAGTLVSVGLVLLGVLLAQVRQRAVVPRFNAAIDGHLFAIGAGVTGTVLGALIAVGYTGDHLAEMRDAHITVNLLGLVGLVIAATVPYFAATVARTKVSTRATSVAVRSVVGALGASVALAAGAEIANWRWAAAIALWVYAAGVVAILVLLPPLGRRRFTWAGARLFQLLAGIGWWSLAVTLLGFEALDGEVVSTRLVTVLVVGGYAQIVVASLAYLGPVLRGGGHERLAAGFATTRSWPSLVLANAAAVAALCQWTQTLAVLVAVWGADIAWRAATLIVGRGPRAAPAPVPHSPDG
jgi:nitrite reductase (NO-forming)